MPTPPSMEMDGNRHVIGGRPNAFSPNALDIASAEGLQLVSRSWRRYMQPAVGGEKAQRQDVASGSTDGLS
jgi:hypothetical protein